MRGVSFVTCVGNSTFYLSFVRENGGGGVGSKKFSLMNPFNAAYRVFVCQPKRNDTITRRLRSHLLENFAFGFLYSIGLDSGK